MDQNNSEMPLTYECTGNTPPPNTQEDIFSDPRFCIQIDDTKTRLATILTDQQDDHDRDHDHEMSDDYTQEDAFHERMSVTTSVPKPIPYVMWHVRQGSDDWLLVRRCFLTASDFATVLGWNPYKTVEELVYEMRNDGKKMRKVTKRQEDAMTWGRQNEDDAGVLLMIF